MAPEPINWTVAIYVNAIVYGSGFTAFGTAVFAKEYVPGPPGAIFVIASTLLVYSAIGVVARSTPRRWWKRG